jgi:hypothetical protein
MSPSLALRRVFVWSALALAAAACASTDRNSRLGPAGDACLDIDSDCRTSHDCCSNFCANHTCVRRDR